LTHDTVHTAGVIAIDLEIEKQIFDGNKVSCACRIGPSTFTNAFDVI